MQLQLIQRHRCAIDLGIKCIEIQKENVWGWGQGLNFFVFFELLCVSKPFLTGCRTDQT